MDLITVLAQPELSDVCGEQPGRVCAWFFERFGSLGPLVADTAEAAVPRLLRILLILVLAVVANRLVNRGIKRFVRSLGRQGAERLGRLQDRIPLADTSPVDLSRVQMRTETLGAVLRSVATAIVWTIAVLMILGTLGVDLAPAIASAGIAGVALGFGAQNLVRDFLSGTFILIEDQYGIGDIVNLREAVSALGVSGTVEGVSLRVTRLRDIEGTVWHVPNGEIRTAGNKSQQWARSLLDVGVAYGTDVGHASAVLKRVADELWRDEEYGPDILEEPEVWGLERFDADQLTIRMVIKVKPARQWAVNRELRARIKQAFDDEGIEIPFPQRTVWLRQPEPAPGDGKAGVQERQRPL